MTNWSGVKSGLARMTRWPAAVAETVAPPCANRSSSSFGNTGPLPPARTSAAAAACRNSMRVAQAVEAGVAADRAFDALLEARGRLSAAETDAKAVERKWQRVRKVLDLVPDHLPFDRHSPLLQRVEQRIDEARAKVAARLERRIGVQASMSAYVQASAAVEAARVEHERLAAASVRSRVDLLTIPPR